MRSFQPIIQNKQSHKVALKLARQTVTWRVPLLNNILFYRVSIARMMVENLTVSEEKKVIIIIIIIIIIMMMMMMMMMMMIIIINLF